MKTCDVYSFGVVSSSTLYTLEGAFPSPQGYAEISDMQHMTGGEATNSSIVLARLGASVRLDGNWLGDDVAGQRTKQLLANYRIDTSRLPLKKGYEGAQEIVFATATTRTIFGTYSRLQEDAAWNLPNEEDVLQAKVICLDPFFGEASARVAEIACDAGIPVVTVDCAPDDPLLKQCSAVVIAESFIRENYPDGSPEALFRAYQNATNGLVVFTFGENAIWYARPGESANAFQPYPIEPVDTAGGGDAFRAGVVYGFLQGWSDGQTVAFAAATAAIVCTRSPGVINSPTLDEVQRFMSESRRIS
ncbi:MAG: hypothetical protein KJN77_05380 [Gammaproteobacteria bacterium]|nr:hypothetical protein [Gammaproteobacteria bacterium]